MEYNKYVDYTLLKAFATSEDIKKLCEVAKENDYASVCVNPHYVTLAKELLKDTNVKICTVVGFPLGQNNIWVKIREAQNSIIDGADEIDMVVNVAKVIEYHYDYLLDEIGEVKDECGDKILKVIIETCYLTPEQIKFICNVACDAGADYVKTSTGFGTRGASIEDIKLMREAVEGRAKIKASGGIKTDEFAMELISAGADRIGTSAEILKREKSIVN